MEFDIFFSISQTPDHNGFTPSESEMFANYYSQLEAADRLGFGVAGLLKHIYPLKLNKAIRHQSFHTGRVKLDFAQIFASWLWSHLGEQQESM